MTSTRAVCFIDAAHLMFAPVWGIVWSFQRLNIALLYLPTYLPNLDLIERLWRFVKKPCLSPKYSPTCESFQQAISTGIQHTLTTHTEEWKRLLILQFQTFQDVPIIGEQHLIPQRSKKKVFSIAA